MSNFTTNKLQKALAITLTALQIPLLMLWRFLYDAVKAEACRVEKTADGYVLVFKWELFDGVLLGYLPIILSLVAGLVLSVAGMIFLLKRKGYMNLTLVCFYAILMIAGGVLIFAFSRPDIMAGNINNLGVSEYTFYRYAGEPISFDTMEWLFPLLRSVKFVLLGLQMAGSGTLCGLGIADFAKKRRRIDV